MKRIYAAFKYALQGLKHALKSEFAFQVEFILSVFLIPFAFVIGQNSLEVVFLVASTLLILIVELLNTSIETTLNRIGQEDNDITKIAKDLASGSVLLALVLWIFVWSVIVIF